MGSRTRGIAEAAFLMPAVLPEEVAEAHLHTAALLSAGKGGDRCERHGRGQRCWIAGPRDTGR